MVPLQAADVVPLLGAIVVCYCWGGDDQLWGNGRCAIAGCHCRVPLWCVVVGILRKWCHCSVLWLGASVTTNFGGVGMQPLLGAAPSNGTQKRHPEKLP